MKQTNIINPVNSSSIISDKVENRINRGTRLSWLWGGHALLGLGFIGMFLPVLPTTVFWIGAAICYAKSSPRHYQKLISHERYGNTIRDFMEQGVISRQGKTAALIGMTFSALILWFTPLDTTARVIGLLVLVAAAVYVVSRPGKRST